VTDNPMAHRIVGRNGSSLAERWETTGLQAYLGTTVPDFPNLFLMAGPNTGTGHTSLVIMIEAQIEYVLRCLRYLDDHAVKTVEVRKRTVDAFNAEVQKRMSSTVWTMGGCSSWYLDKTGRNSTLWPDFSWRFTKLTRRFDPAEYLTRA
jgi:cation diffusion facilitator CzcD-associated flavoprotein CzcO